MLAVAAALLVCAAPPAGRRRVVARPGGSRRCATAAIAYLYLTRRLIPAKYLIPGTLFLIAFQVFPVLYTVSTAFTNFGDGHRGDKHGAPSPRSRRGSVRQAPGSPEYNLTIAR